MKTTRRTLEFTVEKSERFLVRRRRTIYANCPECGRDVELLSPERAAATAGFTTRAIYRLVEDKQIHFTETDDGQLLICLDSLFSKE